MGMRGESVARTATLEMLLARNTYQREVLTDFSGIACTGSLDEPRNPCLRPWDIDTSAQEYNMNRLPDEVRGRYLHRIQRLSSDP